MTGSSVRTFPLGDLAARTAASQVGPGASRVLFCVSGCGYSERVPHTGNPSGLVCRDCMSADLRDTDDETRAAEFDEHVEIEPKPCTCTHDWERHGPEAGGCIECRCTLRRPQARHFR